jgi:hypothetical protein
MADTAHMRFGNFAPYFAKAAVKPRRGIILPAIADAAWPGLAKLPRRVLVHGQAPAQPVTDCSAGASTPKVGAGRSFASPGHPVAQGSSKRGRLLILNEQPDRRTNCRSDFIVRHGTCQVAHVAAEPQPKICAARADFGS